MAGRPRASILSLFDPLSSSTDYDPNPDKENHAGESSFFHPPSAKSPRPLHTFHRRLIDIGDMTMDEPSIQDLLEDEEELEQLHAIEDDDDGNTLTWKDMAKAATPQWSKRHLASFTTPKASPSQRVPLGELSLREDATPVARKKPYKRPITSATSTISEENPTPTCTIAILPPSPQKEMFSPKETSDSNSDHLPIHATDPLASSVSTLNLPTVTGTSIADTTLPLSMSMNSSQSSQSSISSQSPNMPTIDIPSPRATLRPIRDVSFDHNRHSVDLGASFQLHLNSSDAICDLLNEKISFLDAKDNSFLRTLEMDSFDEDDFESPFPEEGKMIQNPRLAKRESANTQGRSDAPKIEDTAAKDDRDGKATFTKRSSQTMTISLRDPMRKSSIDVTELNVPSTPSSSRSTFNPIVPPVPGLKIVKKTRILTRRLSTATNSSTTATTAPTVLSNQSSHIPAEISITSRTKFQLSTPSSPVTVEPTTRSPVNGSVNAGPTRRPTLPAQSTESSSRDGPRRVLVSGGPKLTSTANSKAPTSCKPVKPSANGPRRVPVSVTGGNRIQSESTMNSTTALKQPAKHSTSGPTSAIPKPISRIPGSRLPAPSSMTSSKSRIGAPSGTGSVAGKGISNRRVL